MLVLLEKTSMQPRFEIYTLETAVPEGSQVSCVGLDLHNGQYLVNVGTQPGGGVFLNFEYVHNG
jgi:hypothetical protein